MSEDNGTKQKYCSIKKTILFLLNRLDELYITQQSFKRQWIRCNKWIIVNVATSGSKREKSEKSFKESCMIYQCIAV